MGRHNCYPRTVDCRAVSLVIKSGDVRQDFCFPLCCLNKQVYWLKTIVRNATLITRCNHRPMSCNHFQFYGHYQIKQWLSTKCRLKILKQVDVCVEHMVASGLWQQVDTFNAVHVSCIFLF